ncbi:uncharacterized protein N7459_001533 [Penicillium hispanicum]|uniref:uncharacterized protein n=1 Tax=Penicillium hispanicum TaxID=1080232 RepID=UPI0025400343|nr:uncharacterized protein N7459_001533 [Penicillium hispanicum]KAJ5595325.1 hypothetical protein N7459_001533 [Penicillium hispanicum]
MAAGPALGTVVTYSRYCYPLPIPPAPTTSCSVRNVYEAQAPLGRAWDSRDLAPFHHCLRPLLHSFRNQGLARQKWELSRVSAMRVAYPISIPTGDHLLCDVVGLQVDSERTQDERQPPHTRYGTVHDRSPPSAHSMCFPPTPGVALGDIEAT